MKTVMKIISIMVCLICVVCTSCKDKSNEYEWKINDGIHDSIINRMDSML